MARFAEVLLAIGIVAFASSPSLGQRASNGSSTRMEALEPWDPLANRLDFPQPFLAPKPSPREICKRLDESGFSNGGWGLSNLGAGYWECYSSASDARGFFFLMRGTEERVSEARAKVTVEDAGATAFKMATSFVDAFSSAAEISFPPVFIEQVRAGEPAEYTTSDRVFRFVPEYGTPLRYNLTIVEGAHQLSQMPFSHRALADTQKLVRSQLGAR